MRSWIQLALISVPISILAGCNFIQAVQKPMKLYEGHERSREELALLNFCVVIGRAYPGRVSLRIDGKDVMMERHSQASDRARSLDALSCRARILPGEHKVYYKASGSKWPGSSFKGVVDFKAGKAYYFIFDGCSFCWAKDRSSAWLEDEDGNVVAGEKLK